MRNLFVALAVVLVAASVSAKEYGSYDLKKLVTATETSTGKKYGFDVAYLDQVLNDLSTHAGGYPTQFDTAQDKLRASQDAKALSGMLDVLVNGPSPSTELLVRAGYVNSIGHNLDIPGAAEKASAIFLKLLAIAPADPRGNSMYGIFLASLGKPKEALPYLEKAVSGGVVDAAYTIGLTYLALGDKEQALKYLEDYKRHKPDDGNVDKVIDAIRHGKVEVKRSSD